jgi:hypothetical protein
VRRHGRRATRPIFLDRSGRRRRVVVASGAAAAVLMVLALTMLVAGLFGASPIPLPGLPDLGRPAPSPQAPPTSDQVAPPSAGPAVTPGASATVEPSSRRHTPTQTPTDHGRPSKP